ncbi:helix-turn-helix domain-containing protein [Haloplanus salinarum]|jgi:predicted DNA binding protein
MWEILIAVRHTGCPISDTTAHSPDVHLQNLARTRRSDEGDGKRLLRVRSDRADAIEEFVTRFGDHDRSIMIDTFGQQSQTRYITTHIEYDEDNPSISTLVQRNQFYHRGVVPVSRGIEHWIVYTDEFDDVTRLIDDVEANDNSIEKYRIREIGNGEPIESFEYSTVLSKLTTKQQSVFETALESGYYSDDEKTTLEDLAEEIGLHQTTVWEHLSKAENTILTEVGTRLFADDDDGRSPQLINT